MPSASCKSSIFHSTISIQSKVMGKIIIGNLRKEKLVNLKEYPHSHVLSQSEEHVQYFHFALRNSPITRVKGRRKQDVEICPNNKIQTGDGIWHQRRAGGGSWTRWHVRSDPTEIGHHFAVVNQHSFSGATIRHPVVHAGYFRKLRAH